MKTRILFLIHTLQVGGAEKALVNLVNNLDRNKFDVTAMTVVDTGAFKQNLAPHIHYKTIIKLPHAQKSANTTQKSGNLLQGKSTIKGLLAKIYQFGWQHLNANKIYRKFITEQYDIEVAFLEGIATKIIAHSTNPNSKKLAWVHVDLLNERKSERFFKNHQEECETYDQFDRIVAVSNTVQNSIIEKLDQNPEKVVTQYNIIDAQEIRQKADAKNISKANFTLCSVGRLSKQKGYDRLLKVVKKLNDDGLKFNLWLIGVGAEEENLQKNLTENHLDNVQLLGYKSNPYPYIKSTDLYVCSSRAEGYSTTVAEALVLGKPVVTTKCSGMHELLGDSEYGIICENNENALYQALKTIIADQKQYQILSRKAAKRQDFFDTQKRTQEYEKFFQGVLS